MDTNHILEFNEIRRRLAEFSCSEYAREKLLRLIPYKSIAECTAKMQETTEGKHLIEQFGTPPLTSMTDLDKILLLAEKGSVLQPEELITIAGFINSCKRMKTYLKKGQEMEMQVVSYGTVLQGLEDLGEEIEQSCRNGIVDDHASSELYRIRKKIETLHAAVKSKLSAILQSRREWFSDGYVTERGGRPVLPVKREYKSQVAGIVVEMSNTGGTCFIEPASIRKLQDELAGLKIEEHNETLKILYTLTALVDTYSTVIKQNKECMETLDVIFAKAKLSMDMQGIPVPLQETRAIQIVNGRHPLLSRQECIPLNFQLGGQYRGIVITGPNTGGKTVALKTVGLLSMMAQSGLHVPAEEGSCFCLASQVLCDIGDGQSITENLSTFSSHIRNIIAILKQTSEDSLVLLDELGSGTDPAEGMGLAVSILEELAKKQCLFVATTHYPRIKEFAQQTEGMINARMAFDKESLKPLYQLEIGEAGESCAFYIARRLGFPENMLKRAYEEAYITAEGSRKAAPEMQFEAQSSMRDPHQPSPPRLPRQKILGKPSPASLKFEIGDSVVVYPGKEIGIVYQTADRKGMVEVQIKGRKEQVNHKRLKLKASAKDLYPENYDFSIIFDSAETRKARHDMNRKYVPGLIIPYGEEET